MIALSELQGLSLHEKLQMMETLWDGISSQEMDLHVPQWHKDLLEERDQAIHSGEARFIDWETAKQQIRDTIS